MVEKIYSTKWYAMTLKNQNVVKFIMIMSMNDLKLTYGFYDLNFDSFINVSFSDLWNFW